MFTFSIGPFEFKVEGRSKTAGTAEDCDFWDQNGVLLLHYGAATDKRPVLVSVSIETPQSQLLEGNCGTKRSTGLVRKDPWSFGSPNRTSESAVYTSRVVNAIESI